MKIVQMMKNVIIDPSQVQRENAFHCAFNTIVLKAQGVRPKITEKFVLAITLFKGMAILLAQNVRQHFFNVILGCLMDCVYLTY